MTAIANNLVSTPHADTTSAVTKPPQLDHSLEETPAVETEIVPGNGSADRRLLDVVDRDGRLPPFPVPWRHPIKACVWLARTAFGLASLIVLLAVVAAIPVLNFLALGYLLEVEGRVGRSGRIRDGFPLLNVAPRMGSIALGLWLWLLPLRLLAGAATDAAIINPAGKTTSVLQGVVGTAWLLVTIHLCLALARGGSLTCFVRPIKNLRWLRGRLRDGNYLETASEHVRRFVKSLRLKHHFWLGLRGFVGAFAWLALPTLIFAISEGTTGVQVLTKILGGALLALTLSWVPFLQARLATENKLSAAFSLREIRRLFCFAPLAWLLTLVLVYVLALPLYLFKAFLLPRDAMWPITLIFIASIYPARIVTGWAYHRAVVRRFQERRAHWSVRWLTRLAIVPLLAAFVFLLHFTQFVGANGTAGLFEHHAFLLPWAGAPSI